MNKKFTRLLPQQNDFTPVLLMLVFFTISGCKDLHPASKPRIVEKPAEMDANVTDNIQSVLQYAEENNGKINDSVKLFSLHTVAEFYKHNDYKNIWSKDEHWLPLADSLNEFIKHSESYGLFPNDYHFKELQTLKGRLDGDSTAKTDANLWTKADLMLTDGFILLTKHLKKGRLQPDSITIAADTLLTDNFSIKNLKNALENNRLTAILDSLEPTIKSYRDLKNGIPAFLDSMDRRIYTYVSYPYKDSLGFVKNLQRRLFESGYIGFINKLPDSLQLANGIKKFQKAKGIKADALITIPMIRNLNTSDAERFKRIAITLDRYKQLPEKMPVKYIWVNLPGYYLQVWDNDTVAMYSKVIVGKPTTRTPALNSRITDMVTYPKWTIPNSIIKKDILPALKRDPGYLARKGFSLLDGKGEVVNPYTITWAKYSKGIPYKIQQGSGDDNALGIFKFNFNNPYSVYLHDTNQRYLFKNASRALSHGCVRVQEWEKLAFYIARNDSLSLAAGDSLSYNSDSIKTWLASKERKRIVVKDRLPIFIRYFTCECKDGKIIFYDDIYGEDKSLREKYFAAKN
ncbi:MAG: L,D-transpeptidase family protein [Chitinophagaceae bacterium]|nr:L,D-transpeptidase family protein [Chitinophagaceae bacterium]